MKERVVNGNRSNKARVKLEYPIERPDRITVEVSSEGTIDELREDVVSQIRDTFLPYRLRISTDIRSALIIRVCGTKCSEYHRVILEVVRTITGRYYREVQLA